MNQEAHTDRPRRPLNPKEIASTFNSDADAARRVEALKAWREYSDRMLGN